LSETLSFGRSLSEKERAGLFTPIFPSAKLRKGRISVTIPNAALNIDEELPRFYWASGTK